MTDRIAQLEAQLAESRAQTRSAFENRALMYSYILDELEQVLGLAEATEVMKRAIYRRGLEVGAKYRPAAQAGDLAEVARIFVEGSPAEGALFEPGVEEADPSGDRIVLRMTACPLADAWRKAGYDAERVDLLCEISAAVDEGTFEGAGLDLLFLDRQACAGAEKCLLELKLRSE